MGLNVDMIEEVWKDLEFDGIHGYKISNYGRVMTPKGKIKKLEMHEAEVGDKINVRVELKQILNGVRMRKVISVGHWVYKLFSDDPPKFADFNIYHIDGNPENNRIDNLRCACTTNCQATEEQMRIFNKSVYKCIKHYLKCRGWTEYQDVGLDVDSIIQESAVAVWKYLHQYTTDRSFYGFVKRYTRMCALAEFNKWNKYYFGEYIDEYRPNQE